ncbi:vesicular-fusion protein SEC17 [Rhizoctonia solani AG-1 IA]|uniref:Vesicular-fusion protein SEC17 n=1 Tax=Thanatephorus cucumeris (strain AG1-IA) TaxID=983506 RepID=L8WUM4_THACA|nr:vesicular-fusion protein SEC17 [Rhizoctonia solani AG-1 IA]
MGTAQSTGHSGSNQVSRHSHALKAPTQRRPHTPPLPMAPSLSQAQQLRAKADKKFNSSTGWFSSSSSKYEEAGDLYQQAANSFKIDKEFKEAGDAFMKEGECREQSGEKDDAANAYWNAAKAYNHLPLTVASEAARALTMTITLLTKAGRFRQAADREKEIAQIYLQEKQDLGKACESFERAAEWYAQEDAMDAADLHAELGNYGHAIALYQKVADHSMTSALTKYSVKEYWLRAGLCALAMQDTVTVRRNMQLYGQKDVTFTSTREAKFINTLTDAVEAGDKEGFTNAVFEYDQRCLKGANIDENGIWYSIYVVPDYGVMFGDAGLPCGMHPTTRASLTLHHVLRFAPYCAARHGHSVDPAERNNEHSETINCLADTLVSTPDTLNIIHTCIPCVLTGSHLTRSHPWDHAPLDAMAISHVVIHAITNAPGGIADNVQGMASLLVIQFTGRKGKEVAEQGESAQFGLLVGAAAAYVAASWWLVVTYPVVAVTPLSSTLVGAAVTTLVFLTLIGFAVRRTNVIETAGLALYVAYNIWLCSETGDSDGYGEGWIHISINFIRHTLPKPLLVSLFYRLSVLHLASRILPLIGGDSWAGEAGVDDGWDERPASIIKFRYAASYTACRALLDHTSQVWWRWTNIFFTLAAWSVEILLTGEDDDLGVKWKVD